MRKSFWLSTIAMFLLVAFTSAAMAATKVAVLDISKVVKEYSKYKDASERLEKEVGDTRTELEKEQKDLAKRKNDLDVQKGILSEKKFSKLEEQVQKDQQAFLDKYRNEQQAIVKKQKTLLENVENDVINVVQKIAKKEKYDMVLDKNAVYYYEGDDITYKVLDALNK